MSTSSRTEILKGTLDMLILQAVAAEPRHGHAIVQAIHESSREVLLVDHGSLYPALHRLEQKGWISSAWGTSANNRKAKFYNLTASGRRQLSRETAQWRRFAEAIGHALSSAVPERS